MNRRARLLLALLLPVAAGPAFGQGVETPRSGARALEVPEEGEAFQFVVYGDRTGGVPEGLDVLRRAVAETNLLDPDFVMTVGDLVNGYNTTKEWLEQMKAYRAAMAKLRMRWYPVAGNHDIYWRGPGTPAGHHERNYEKHFGPLWYSFRHKNAAFVVLYSDEGDKETNRKGWRDAKVNRFSAEQLDWLRGTLRETKSADHVFVFLHHPRWIESIYPDSNWDAVHALLREAGNVRAVMAGHIHRRRYDGRRDGIEYMTLAVVGGHMPYEAQGTGWLNHFNVVTVRRDRVSYASVAVGATLDPKAMTKEHWAEVDALRALQAEHLGVVDVSPVSDAAGEYALRFTNPTSRPIRLVVEGPRDGWWFRPDHVHATLAPGRAHEFRFGYGRLPGASPRLPRFEIGVEYEGPSQRVSLPPRRIPARVRLAGLDDGFWNGAEDRALRLVPGRAGVSFDATRMELPDGPFTVEAWVKPHRHARRAGLVAKNDRSEYGILLDDGTPNFLVHLGGRYAAVKSSRGPLPIDTWTHVAGVFDGSSVRLYVDGRLAGRRAASGERTRNDLPLFVGADPDRHGRPASTFDGWIDEVRVSRGARYEGDSFAPVARFEPDGAALLLVHFDRALGPFHPDHSARNAHGTAVGRIRLEARR